MVAKNVFCSFEDGNNANDGTTYANRVKTWDSSGLTSGRVAAGDTCRFMASPDATSLGNATWTNASSAVTLASACTLMVFDCASAFTDATGGNMTVSTSATRKEGSVSSSILPAGGFTTGLMVYKALAGSTDYSAYQQLCCWIRASAVIAANTLRIDLCSDTIGAVPVDSFTINFAIDPVNTWHAVVLNKGSALGATIQSVAIVALLDPGTPTILIDDIFCSKSTTSADCLTLHSVLRKNGGVNANYGWCGVSSVNGTAILLEKTPAGGVGSGLAYPGATELVATDVRQCIPVPPVNVATTIIMTNQRSGTTEATRTYYSGGWDRTNMSTQTGETFVCTVNGMGTFLSLDGNAYVSLEKFSIFRARDGHSALGTLVKYVNITDCNVIVCNISGFGYYGYGCKFTRCGAFSTAKGWFANGNVSGNCIYDTCYAYSNTVLGFTSGANDTYINCQSRYSVSGWYFPPNTSGTDATRAQLISCIGSNNSVVDVDIYACTVAATALNCLWSSALDVTLNASATWLWGTYFRSHNDDQTAGNHVITGDTSLITCQTATVHTAGGKAWKIKPSTTDRTSQWPIDFPIATVKLTANVPQKVRCWFRRGDATNCSASLVCPGMQITGITTDISTAASAATDAWEQLSITITGHTVTDTVAVYARVWVTVATVGANVYTIVDDVSY